MSYALTVNGVAKAFQPGWSHRAILHNKDIFRVDLQSLDGTDRVALDDALAFTKDATPIVGALIDSAPEGGLGGYGVIPIETGITAVGLAVLLEQKLGTIDIPAESSLLDALTLLEPDFPAGITLDPAQVVGPVLTTAVGGLDLYLGSILNKLSQLTGYAWRVSPTGVLSMFDPGSFAAPFIAIPSRTIGDVKVEPTRTDSADRIILVAGGSGPKDKIDEVHDADGVVTSWVLDAPAMANPETWISVTLNQYGVRVDSRQPENLAVGTYGVDNMPFTYEAATNTVHHDPLAPGSFPVLAAGDFFLLSYVAQYPIRVEAGVGAREKKLIRDDINSRPEAQAIADGLVEAYAIKPKVVTYETALVDGLSPGQQQVILCAARAVWGLYLITEVWTRNTRGNAVRATVRAIEGRVSRGSFIDYYTGVDSSMGGDPGIDAFLANLETRKMQLGEKEYDLGGRADGTYALPGASWPVNHDYDIPPGYTAKLRLWSKRDAAGTMQLIVKDEAGATVTADPTISASGTAFEADGAEQVVELPTTTGQKYYHLDATIASHAAASAFAYAVTEISPAL